MKATEFQPPSSVRVSATRALKNARHLQKIAPHVMPRKEPTGGFGSIIPIRILAQLHRPDRRAALMRNPRLAAMIGPSEFPESGNTAVDALFSGVLSFAHILFTIQDQNNAVLEVSSADVQTAIDYALKASVPISEYATQYGPNSIGVSSDPIDFAVTLPTALYNDAQLQGWVNQFVSDNGLPSNACVVILNPTSIVNTDADPAQGIGGYHGLANVPYCFVNTFGQNLTIDDRGNLYAQVLSHEIAEMAVDPRVDGQNPEVCDACGPNCQTVYLDYFDERGAYMQTSQALPPAFAYSFFINAIVQPASATTCPAPGSACAYSPSPLFMAWKGVQDDQGIWFSTDFGGGWAPQENVAGIGTSFRPALASYNFFDSFTETTQIHMAWKGIEGDQGIWFIKFDGNPQQQVPGVGTSVGPSLAVYNDLLYMAWKGVVGDQGIWFTTYDGSTWAPQQNIPGIGTSVGPSLAVFNGLLYMVWKGIEGDQGIWFSSFDGNNWAPQQNIAGVGTSVGPALAAYDGLLNMVWKGIEGDQGIWFSTFDGNNWAPQENIAGIGTSVGPSLAVYEDLLYMAWKGIEGDQGIWFSTFDGNSWAPQQNIAGVGSSVGPALLPAFPLPAIGQSAASRTRREPEKTDLMMAK
ncbi:hypothetical protein C2L64_47165 [Paraburkholderia hospita]|uniref:Uncharacterized protein n=1 Tax=Paraburkholderia hospita TaxID=169430 RepID=A0AAN1MQP6_9BURK|nr:hypothetical protein [Paraburkholderia hospita]AUT75864.1 hypothetical protein C2L64_47165 [Paraburkholderia hospita]